MKLTVYCLDWHITASDAFKLLLSEPLQQYTDLEFIPWNGKTLPRTVSTKETVIFAMLPPTEQILKRSKGTVVWVPMWDQAQGYTTEWWNNISQYKNLKVVAFSDVIAKRSLSVKIPTLHLKYFCDPSKYSDVSWSNGNVLYYWNRVGLVGPDFIKKICKQLDITKLIFRPELDPGINRNLYYELPSNLAGTEVTTIKSIPSKAKYLKTISSANIFIAPRLTEGVGMAFLEMMARGGLVIAHNAPTMDEYIKDGYSGLLIEKINFSNSKKLTNILHINQNATNDPYLMNVSRSWRQFKKVNPQFLGANAKAQHQLGYKKWIKDQRLLVDFILNRS